MRIQFTIVAEPKKPVSRVCILPSPTSSFCLHFCLHGRDKYYQVWLRLDGGDGGDGRERRVEHILNIQVHQILNIQVLHQCKNRLKPNTNCIDVEIISMGRSDENVTPGFTPCIGKYSQELVTWMVLFG